MNISFWINTTNYTIPQLFWNGIGCSFWLITYIAIARNSYKTKFVEMPFVIAAGNISWEFVWSFCFHPDTGRFYTLGYQASFFLDVYIFWMVLKYGSKQIEIPVIKKHFKAIMIGLLVLWGPLNYFFVAQGFDTTIGANSGYILNLMISMLYPFLYFRSDPSYFSRLVSWSRFIGTGCITVSMFLIYPENHFLHILGIACFIFDLAFTVLLEKNKIKVAKR